MVTVDEFKRESVRDVTVIVNASLIDSCECGWCALIVCVYLFFFWGGKSLNAFVVGRSSGFIEEEEDDDVGFTCTSSVE